MLRELTVENFALIDRLRLELRPGFTVLTGETGAGKSIIIDALNAALGERVGAEAIRGGEAVARVEAVFDASDAPRALQVMDRLGLREGHETTIVLSREIASGRSSYRVNRRPSTLAVLQDIGRHLVDIHGQHEHQTLIHEENHLSFLDTFGGPRHLELRSAYQAAYSAFADARDTLAALQTGERERAQRLDLLRYQISEIDAAGLQPDEETALAIERRRLQQIERIREAAVQAHRLLDGDETGSLSATAALQEASRLLSMAAEADPGLLECATEAEAVAATVGETVRTLNAYLDGLEADPQRLEQIEQRLAEIARLKRKYGDSVAQVLAFRDRAAAELAQTENLEAREAELRRLLEQRRKTAGDLAQELSCARARLAGELAATVEAELAGLGMDAARLSVELYRDEDDQGLPGVEGKRYAATLTGIDQCRFLFSANPGEALRPLSKIASGGELSRLMLAFKSICSRGAEIPTIVFDEVDVGIGGRVAHAVGEKLLAVSAAGQALCVTHLPQIARLADTHIRVRKETVDGRTVVRAEPIEGKQRVEEVARMLGAVEHDMAAHRHALELLQDAEASRGRVRARAACRTACS